MGIKRPNIKYLQYAILDPKIKRLIKAKMVLSNRSFKLFIFLSKRSKIFPKFLRLIIIYMSLYTYISNN